MDTHAQRNKALSLQAKGLHAYLMQLPPDWQITIEGLTKTCTDGRTAIASSMNELILAGYVTRQPKKGGANQFSGIEYHVFEQPDFASEFEESTVSRFSACGKPERGKTARGKPEASNNDSTVRIKGLNSEEEGIAQAREKNETGLGPKAVNGFTPGAPPAPFTAFNAQAALDSLPTDQPTLEAFVRRTGLNSAEYGSFCADFKVHCAALGQEYHKRADLIRHFLNWAGAKVQYAAKAAVPPTPRQAGRPGTMPVSTSYDLKNQSFRP